MTDIDLDELERLSRLADERPDFSYGMALRKFRHAVDPQLVLALIERVKAEMVRLETENAELRAANAELTEAERQWEQFSNAYSRAERAEAVIAAALELVSNLDVPLGQSALRYCDRLLAETRTILATYQNGADHG